ncbi:hypothetical protein EON81_03525 [bacterium]|nr:MAG: hypothetical protein EON81_03525 [bacterium]
MGRQKTDGLHGAGRSVLGRLAIHTGQDSAAVVDRNGKIERLSPPDGYDAITVFFANGRLLANVYKRSVGPTTNRLHEWAGRRWIDRGPSHIMGVSASGKAVLIWNVPSETYEVVWVAKP